ncbi:LSM_domain [Hexamita inflata]|uniref:Eukaryotic/archaea-type n=1 Tax=Hexamita inflata TaxID=28002 RepID=A0AA86REF6_9EUKA|nr:LSM domain [Hexamita inflata]CAI9976471.1 LSM domain [Hexamita inflata]
MQNFFNNIKGQQIKIETNQGDTVIGRFIQIDHYLNIFMDECTVTLANEKVEELDNLFIKGQNILYVSQL